MITAAKIKIYGTAHADQRYHTTDRDINAAGDHDKTHATRGNDERCLRIQDIEESLRL